MQTIYLIRKNPRETGTDNWLILDGTEFNSFRASGEGRKRTGNLVLLPDADGSGPDIFVECGGEMRRKLSRERNRRQYVRRRGQAVGILLVPGPEAMEADWTGENRFAEEWTDPSPGPEERLYSLWEQERLARMLDRLNVEERELVGFLYLRDKPIGVNRYAAAKGISCSAAWARKEKVLAKMRRWMEE